MSSRKCLRERVIHHVTVTCLVLQLTTAFKMFQERLPNGDRVPNPCSQGDVWGGVGHLVPGGQGSRNPFGEDFHKEGKNWTQQLCLMDSDGDGRTNGEELGDPNCVWSFGGQPQRTTNITHPGVCDPWNSVQCQARNGWLKCGSHELHCPVIKKQSTRNLSFTFPETRVPARETTYYCQLFDLPVDDDYHLVATEPILVNRDTVHHILLFGCDPTDSDVEATPEPFMCAMLAHRSCLDIIGTWTVGSQGDCLHNNVGFSIGKTGYRKAALQIHWNNPRLLANATDASGLKMYFTPSRRSYDAGMLLVGQEYLEITPQPAPSPLVTFSQSCPGRCTREMLTEPIFITATINHMHYRGVSQRIELYRNGSKVRDITYDRFYHYDNPVIYSFNPPVEVRPGDEIRTTCVYKTPTSGNPMCFGDGTQDEMCYGFITYYPKQNLPIPWCTARKSVQKCDRYLPKFRNNSIDGCFWLAFLQATNQDTINIFTSVLGHCFDIATGENSCTDSCLSAIEAARKHPCLSGDIGSYIISKFRHTSIGFKFLNALFTCDCEGRFDNGYCDKRYRGGILGEGAQKMCAARYTSIKTVSPYNGAQPLTSSTILFFVSISIISVLLETHS
ncbi:uncharacterized protein LOC124138380 isoform X1 [Haliotis rufescens]|uniref:uncharacterized protein LOC124138380 isoform X1 n=1 Tax=Haliotis rufescens TaxID=6454 RepID=UPI00201EE228|nr:uncharacterized protein LOC124138380 isoform X1 [Haliotis rufescens]